MPHGAPISRDLRFAATGLRGPDKSPDKSGAGGAGRGGAVSPPDGPGWPGEVGEDREEAGGEGLKTGDGFLEGKDADRVSYQAAPVACQAA